MSAAGSAAGRAVGPLLLGGVRSTLERRAIHKRADGVQFEGAAAVENALEGISATDRERILEFTKSAEFDNICFQVAIAGCMPQNPEEHLTQLRVTFDRSLRRYSGVPDSKSEIVANALFSEICAISWREVNKHQHERGIKKRSLTPELIASHISAATRNGEIHSQLASLSAIDRFADQFSQQCAKLHGKMRPAQTESGARVPFDDLYVEPRLSVAGDKSSRDERVSVRDLLSQAGRVVVLGDPGGGKTTLSLKLTLDVAMGRGTCPARQIPLRIVLREYASHFASNQESIVEFLEKQAKSTYSTTAPEGAIEYLLLNGRSVVIFDGLDELTDTSLRLRVVDSVEAFAYAYPTTPILVTSRRVGYEMAPLDGHLFFSSHLSPFDRSQQRQYVTKWFTHVRGGVAEGGMAERFLAESRHADDLTSNPLMLGLMCALYRGEGYIPRNRPDLFRRCSEFLFERWDASRSISVVQPFERNIQFAMFSLALSMLRNSENGLGMTERELIRYTSDFLLGQQYEDRDSADAAAEAFVRYCRGRAWVLTDVGTEPTGERIYSFTHRTFLEYFSARQLVRDSGDAEGLFRELTVHLKNESWDVTSQLAVQFLDERLSDAANDFVSLALQESRELGEGVPRSALVSFCARLLEFMQLKPALVREIITELRSLGQSTGRPGVQDAIGAAWEGVAMCASETRKVVVDSLLLPSRGASTEFEEIACALSMSEFVPHHAGPEVRKFWSRRDQLNAVLLSDKLVAASRSDVHAAATAVLFGVIEISDAAKWHGPKVATVSVFSGGSTRFSHNLISELARPVRRWNHDDIDSVREKVLDYLIAAPTPWHQGFQRFVVYSKALPEEPNAVKFVLLSWMLGVEHVEGGMTYDRASAHALLVSVAEMRKAGCLDSRFDEWKSKLGEDFSTLVERWARREISLSSGGKRDRNET
ncbi:NACHT domain-containing protein [Streptomyces sp. JL4002]|uniref:NACHT domain-containing protein n=1 Tax=Streptomyces TaxID=1883 RepID=UPI003B28836E